MVEQIGINAVAPVSIAGNAGGAVGDRGTAFSEMVKAFRRQDGGREFVFGKGNHGGGR